VKSQKRSPEESKLYTITILFVHLLVHLDSATDAKDLDTQLTDAMLRKDALSVQGSIIGKNVPMEVMVHTHVQTVRVLM